MIALLQQLKEEIEILLDGELYDDPANEGSTTDVQVEIGSIAPKRSGQQNENDFPFVIIRPMTGGGGDRKSDLTVRLLLGVFTAGDIVSGITAIDKLAASLLQLRSKRMWNDFTMQQHIDWRYGDKDGRHTNHYYEAEINLGFNRAKTRTC